MGSLVGSCHVPGVPPVNPQRLLLALRALGATTSPRFDGHYFSLSGVTGSYVVGERSPDEPDDGDFTICRVPLPVGAPALVMGLRPQTMREQRDLARGDAIDVELGDPDSIAPSWSRPRPWRSSARCSTSRCAPGSSRSRHASSPSPQVS